MLWGWISFQGKMRRCQLTPALYAAWGAKTACTAPNQGSGFGTRGSGLGAGLTAGWRVGEGTGATVARGVGVTGVGLGRGVCAATGKGRKAAAIARQKARRSSAIRCSNA